MSDLPDNGAGRGRGRARSQNNQASGGVRASFPAAGRGQLFIPQVPGAPAGAVGFAAPSRGMVIPNDDDPRLAPPPVPRARPTSLALNLGASPRGISSPSGSGSSSGRRHGTPVFTPTRSLAASSPLTPSSPAYSFSRNNRDLLSSPLPSPRSNTPLPSFQIPAGVDPNTPAGRKMALDQYKKVLDSLGKKIHKAQEIGDGLAFITGVTGSGKSVCSPHAYLKFLMEQPDGAANLKPIIICEPRKVAAIGLSARLRQILPQHGLRESDAGYQVGGGIRNTVTTTKLIFTTAGWLKKKLSFNPDHIYAYSAIIVDEAHEMNEHTECVIACLHKSQKKFHQAPTSTKTPKKVLPVFIFMSATMQLEDIYRHFRPNATDVSLIRKCTVKLTQAMNEAFTVTDYFLDTLPLPSPPTLDRRKENAYRNAVDTFESKGGKTPTVNTSLFPVIHHFMLDYPRQSTFGKGPILLFLPGVAEIETAYDAIFGWAKNGFRYRRFHGGRSRRDLQAIVQEAQVNDPNLAPLLILATNIAESSLTIPHVSIIFDFCLEKTTGYDENTRIRTLKLRWVSIPSRTQRKGRTGRNCNGMYVALVLISMFAENAVAEILRIPLEDLILEVLAMRDADKSQDKTTFMSDYFTQHLMNKPDINTIQRCMELLLASGTILVDPSKPLPTLHNATTANWNRVVVTELGKKVQALQMEEWKAKMIIMADVLGITEDAVFVASEPVDRDRTLFPRYTRDLAMHHSKLNFCRYVLSDAYTTSSTYRAWLLSRNTTRMDGQPKRYVVDPNKQRPRGTSQRAVNPTSNVDFDYCNRDVLDEMNDREYEIKESMAHLNLKHWSGQFYQMEEHLGRPRLVEVKQEDKELHFFLIACCTPIHQWFQTVMDAENFTPHWDEDVPVLSSVYLTPAVPVDCDLSQYGGYLQEQFSQPSGLAPSVYNDMDNDRVILTYPAPPRNLHLGMIHPSVLDCVQRKILNRDWTFTLNYISSDESGATDNPSTSTTTVSAQPQAHTPVLPSTSALDRQKAEKNFKILMEEEEDDEDKWMESETAPAANDKRREDMLKWVKKEKPIIPSENKYWLLAFASPYSFGLRDFGPKVERDFVNQRADNEEAWEELQGAPLNVNDVVVGTRVLQFPSENNAKVVQNIMKGKFSHNVRRCIIQNTLEVRTREEEEIGEIPQIYVRSLDLGGFYSAPITEFRLYVEAKVPGLFKRPPLAWTCMMNSVKPNPIGCQFWSPDNVTTMNDWLRDSQGDFRALVRPQMVHRNRNAMTMVCFDLHSVPKETETETEQQPKSFREKLVTSANGVFLPLAVIADDIKLWNNKLDQTPQPTFCPCPTGPLVLPPTTEQRNPLRDDKNFKILGTESKEDEQVTRDRSHTFTTIRSPLEIKIEPVSVGLEKYKYLIGRNSINCGFLDPNISELRDEKDYVNRLIICTKMLQTRGEDRATFIILENCGVLPGVIGYAALTAMCTKPTIQLLEDDAGCFMVRVFTTSPDDNQGRLEGKIWLECKMQEQDWIDIGCIRNRMAKIVTGKRMSKEFFRRDITALYHRKRERRRRPLTDVDQLTLPETMRCRNDVFMLPPMQIFHVEDNTTRLTLDPIIKD